MHRSRPAGTHTRHGPRGHLLHGARPHSSSLQPPPRTQGMVARARLAASFGGATTCCAAATTWACPPSLSTAAVWSLPLPLSGGASRPPSTPKHVGWWPVHEAAVAAAAAHSTASRRGGGEGGRARYRRQLLPPGGEAISGETARAPSDVHVEEDCRARPFLGAAAGRPKSGPSVAQHGPTGEKVVERARARAGRGDCRARWWPHLVTGRGGGGGPGNGAIRTSCVPPTPPPARVRRVVGCSAGPPAGPLDVCPQRATRSGEHAARGRSTGQLVAVAHLEGAPAVHEGPGLICDPLAPALPYCMQHRCRLEGATTTEPPAPLTRDGCSAGSSWTARLGRHKNPAHRER